MQNLLYAINVMTYLLGMCCQKFYKEMEVITLPRGSVAKYCDEYVCLSVCEDISRTTLNFLCLLSMSVARSSSIMLMTGHINISGKG